MKDDESSSSNHSVCLGLDMLVANLGQKKSKVMVHSHVFQSSHSFWGCFDLMLLHGFGIGQRQHQGLSRTGLGSARGGRSFRRPGLCPLRVGMGTRYDT